MKFMKSTMSTLMSIALVAGLCPGAAFAGGGQATVAPVRAGALTAADGGEGVGFSPDLVEQYAYFPECDAGEVPLFYVEVGGDVLRSGDDYAVTLFEREDEWEDEGDLAEVDPGAVEAGAEYLAKIEPTAGSGYAGSCFVPFRASSLPEGRDGRDAAAWSVPDAILPTEGFAVPDPLLDGARLVEGRHYTVSLVQGAGSTESPAAGPCTAVFEGIGPFEGSLEGMLDFIDPGNPVNIGDVAVERKRNACERDGVLDVGACHELTVDTAAGSRAHLFSLARGRDFDVVYVDGEGSALAEPSTEIGGHVALVRGRGLFTGLAAVSYDVVAWNDVSLLYLSVDPDPVLERGSSFDVPVRCSEAVVFGGGDGDEGRVYRPAEGVDYRVDGYGYLDPDGGEHAVASTADLPGGACYAVVVGMGRYFTGTTRVPFWVAGGAGDGVARAGSVSFEPADPYVLVSEYDGCWQDGADGSEFFRYDLPCFSDGDKLTVVDPDGVERVYVFGGDDGGDAAGMFVSDGADPIAPEDVDRSSEQEDVHWEAGGSYAMTLTYDGCSCDVPVEVVENPVSEIEFVPARGYRYTERIDGYWDPGAEGAEPEFVYQAPRFQAGDTLVVTAPDGSSAAYVFAEGEDGGDVAGGAFEQEPGGTVIPESEVSVGIDGQGRRWEPGEHVVSIGYLGRRCEVPVELAENPVKSVSYRPASSFELVEGVDGYWADADDGGFFCYCVPDGNEGDVLVVTGADGEDVEYVLVSSDDAGAVYRSDSGEEVRADAVGFSYRQDDQLVAHWSAGETHRLTVSYEGSRCDVPVMIAESPVKAISCEPASLYQAFKESERFGYWEQSDDGEDTFVYRAPCFNEGDRLYVTGRDDVVTAYTFSNVPDGDGGDERGMAFVAPDGSLVDSGQLRFSSDQDQGGVWDVGMHEFALAYQGRTCAVGVEVLGKPDIGDAVVKLGQTSYVYSGDAAEPEVSVSLYGESLDPGVDYTVSYERNVDAGTAVATVRGVGECEGERTLEFEIAAVPLSGADVSGVVDKTFDGHAQTQAPVVSLGGATLVKGRDYTLSYAGNAAVGSATMTVTGKGNYTSSTTVPFKISAASLAGASVTGVVEKMYDGTAQTQAPVVKLGSAVLANGRDYTLSYAGNLNAGTATMTVTGRGNYAGAKAVSFRINPAPIARASVAGLVRRTYNGRAQVQTPAVRLGAVTLRRGVDYTVAHSRNVSAGTATVFVTGKGNYAGVACGRFEIAKAANTLKVSGKTAKVTLGKKGARTVAASKAYRFSKKGKGRVVYRRVAKGSSKHLAVNGKTGRVTVKKGAPKKTHVVKVKIIAKGTANYKARSKTVSVKVRVR